MKRALSDAGRVVRLMDLRVFQVLWMLTRLTLIWPVVSS